MAPEEEQRLMSSEDTRTNEVIEEIVKDVVESILTQAISELSKNAIPE